MGNSQTPVIIHVRKDSPLESECWKFIQKHFPEVYHSLLLIRTNSYWDVCVEYAHFEKMEFHLFNWLRLTCPESRSGSNFKRLEINAGSKVCTTVDIVSEEQSSNMQWDENGNRLIKHKSINTRFIAANCDCKQLGKLFFDRVQDFDYD